MSAVLKDTQTTRLPGFFTMKDASDVLKQPTLIAGRDFLSNIVTTFVAAHPLTKKENVVKAQQMIAQAASLRILSLSVANFILAHENPAFKVIK